MKRTLRIPLAMAMAAAVAITLVAAPATASTDPVPTDRDPALVPAASFTAAERMLRRAIPWAIRRTCVPRRSALPRGTVAAVQCRPAARVVRDMAYYLLDFGPADRVFETRRKQAGVRQGQDGRCVAGKPAVTYWIGGMAASELCYRNKDRRANLRFLEPATRCKQLKIAGKTLKSPTVYVAVLGRDRDIAKLARWATNSGRGNPSVLTRTIRQPGSTRSPACPRY